MDQHIKKTLSTRQPRLLNRMPLDVDPRQAAVLLLLVEENGEDSIIFTKRSHLVTHHKGQICLPGGSMDEGDKTLWHTALREAHEEIGLAPGEISFLGQLGEVITPTAFHVTPFVARTTPHNQWVPCENEIDEIFTIPLSHLTHPDYFKMETKVYFGQEVNDPNFIFKDYKIWGATGRILVDFLEIYQSIKNAS